MKKPICLLTHQRSGSEVVMHYLTYAGYDNAGEALCSFPGKSLTMTAIPGVAADAPYRNKWCLMSARVPPVIGEQYDFFNAELKHRVKTLVEHQRPVIVKAFVSGMLLVNRALNVEHLFENFDVIVLRRADGWRTALSTEICFAMQTWHPRDAEQLAAAKQKLQNLKINIPESTFMHTIKVLNELKVLHDNIATFGPQHRAITYEDFADSPIEKLNGLLGHSVKHCRLPVKFIEDHEAHVSNVERLRVLYDRFALKD